MRPALIRRMGVAALALTLAMIALGPTAHAEPIYRLTNLSSPTTEGSTVYAINNSGQIVGSELFDNSPVATLFNAVSGSARISNVPSIARGINDAGLIVGEAQGRIALFGFGGQTIYLGVSESRANAINNSGLTVGDYLGRPVLVNANSPGVLFLVGGSGSFLGTANSINNSEAIVGFERLLPPFSPIATFYPSRLNPGIPLSPSPSLAFDINNSGQVVGEIGGSTTFNGATLFDTSGNGQNFFLGGRFAGTSARAINDSGLIVGVLGMSSDPVFPPRDPSHAALFGFGDAFDLNDLIAPDDPLRGNVVLTSAADINNAGQIVANGRFTSDAPGFNRAFLLTPVTPIPEPSTIALFGAGLLLGLGLICRRGAAGG